MWRRPHGRVTDGPLIQGPRCGHDTRVKTWSPKGGCGWRVHNTHHPRQIGRVFLGDLDFEISTCQDDVYSSVRRHRTSARPTPVRDTVFADGRATWSDQTCGRNRSNRFYHLLSRPHAAAISRWHWQRPANAIFFGLFALWCLKCKYAQPNMAGHSGSRKTAVTVSCSGASIIQAQSQMCMFTSVRIGHTVPFYQAFHVKCKHTMDYCCLLL